MNFTRYNFFYYTAYDQNTIFKIHRNMNSVNISSYIQLNVVIIQWHLEF
jgi:hypothetical protein